MKLSETLRENELLIQRNGGAERIGRQIARAAMSQGRGQSKQVADKMAKTFYNQMLMAIDQEFEFDSVQDIDQFA